jgi:hypothetical protein
MAVTAWLVTWARELPESAKRARAYLRDEIPAFLLAVRRTFGFAAPEVAAAGRKHPVARLGAPVDGEPLNGMEQAVIDALEAVEQADWDAIVAQAEAFSADRDGRQR